MEDQDRAAIEEEQNCLKEEELELSLGLRPSSICRHFHPKTQVSEGSGDLCLNVPIWGKGVVGSEQEMEGLGFELEAKKEAQALRRQEARKKREGKRKSKANVVIGNSNERLLWFEKQRAAGRENEDDLLERRRKGERNCKNNGVEGTPFLARPQGLVNGNQLNGLPNYYMMMPGLVGSDGNALQPIAGVGAGGFRPYQAVEKNSGNLKQSVSGCSRGSSPDVSDHRSTSGQGGSSSDGGSHSGHSHPVEPATTNAPTTTVTSQKTAPVNPGEMATTSSSNTESCHIVQNQNVAQTETSPIKTTETKVANPVSKPPKPPAQQTNDAMLLSQMPYVSTTGNGPNGKNITGFLYKYTNSEVCIVCVCHGSSFTPAGFIEHAGGVDVENPLKHITVVPFAFT